MNRKKQNNRNEIRKGRMIKMEIKWVDGYRINVETDENSVTLSANREGLLSLARHLMDLSQQAPGSHIHYDEFNSLEEESKELIIERMA